VVIQSEEGIPPAFIVSFHKVNIIWIFGDLSNHLAVVDLDVRLYREVNEKVFNLLD